MKVILEPKVYLIGGTATRAAVVQQFLQDEGVGIPKTEEEMAKTLSTFAAMFAPQALVETAGRVCYMSYGKGRKTNEDFIRNIVAQGHHSVLEHVSWSLLLTGISRSLTHEFVRHRHFSYSQLSQRYVDSKDVAFVVPPGIIGNKYAEDIWKQTCGSALLAYEAIESRLTTQDWGGTTSTLKTKLIRQASRSILPNCTETKMVVTGNARSWREFFDKRGSVHADFEIRRLAVAILEKLKPEAPTIFEDYAINDGLIERVAR